MTTAPAWTDLRAIPAERWLTATLKGTQTDVELVVLHHDPASGAAVSLVRFPAGLERDEPGCYPAAEELAIVDGSLHFAGHVYVAGDYAYVPQRVLRPPMSSPDGLLVLAWFSGAPTWLTDPSERVAGDILRRPLVPGALREQPRMTLLARSIRASSRLMRTNPRRSSRLRLPSTAASTPSSATMTHPRSARRWKRRSSTISATGSKP